MQSIRGLSWTPHDGQPGAARRAAGRLLRTAFADHDPMTAHTLWVLFSRGEPVDRSVAAQALGPETLDVLLASELMVEVPLDPDTWVRANVCLLRPPVGEDELLIAADFPWFADDPEYVGGPGNATSTLLSAALSTPPGGTTAIDVGTGSGAIATALAARYEHVIATDVNPRALAYAELTAALNGRRLDLRLTSYTDGIEEHRAALAVCNPPFVLGAQLATTFRDAAAGLPAPPELAGRLRRCLSPAGRALMLTNWPYRAGAGDARAEVARSLRVIAHDSDLLLIERAVVDAERYAAVWADDTDDAHSWAARLRDQGIDAVGTGLIVVAAPAADDDESGVVDVSAAHHASDAPIGPAIASWHDRLAALRKADDLLEMTVRSAPRQVYDTQTGRAVAAADPLGLAVHGPSGQLSQLVLPLLDNCPSPAQVRDVIALTPMARTVGRSAVLAVIRALIRAGLLIPCEVITESGNKSGMGTFH